MGTEGAYPENKRLTEPPIPSSIDISKQKEVLVKDVVSTGDDRSKCTGKTERESDEFQKTSMVVRATEQNLKIYDSREKLATGAIQK
jgi:hypothetical protein